VIGAGYLKTYPASNMAWFTRQIVGQQITCLEIMTWLAEVVHADNFRHPMKASAKSIGHKLVADVPSEAQVRIECWPEDKPEETHVPSFTEKDNVGDMEEECERVTTAVVESNFPRIHEYGLEVWEYKDGRGIPFVPRKQLSDMLKKQGSAFSDRFHKLFGVQTMSVYGPYPHDTEAVLERMVSGKRTGTQLVWD